MRWLAILNSVILSFIAAELIRVIFFTKQWIFRFNKDPQPIENWKKALIIMALFIFVFPFINWFFVNYLSIVLEYLGAYQISLFFFLLPAIYLWIHKRILSLPWGKADLIPLSVVLLDVVITVLV